MENQHKNSDRVEFNNSQWFIILILAAILIIGAGLRLYKLGSKNLWLDEFVMRSYVGYSYHTLWNNPYLDGNISYPSIVQKFLFELLPEKEFYMRLPTALLSIASLLSIYLLGNVLYGVREGIVATFLLTFSLFHIYLAQEFKLAYMVSTTFYPLAIYSLFKGIEKDQVRYWLIFIISVLSLLYMHFLTIPSIFSMIAWVCLLFILFLVKPSTYWKNIYGCSLSYKSFLKFAVSLSLIFIGYLPVFFVFRALIRSPYGFGGRNSSDIPFRQAANTDFFLNLFKDYSGSGLLFIIFTVMVVCWLISSFKNQREMLIGGFLFSCIFLPFAAYWVTNPSPPLYHRYFIYILPIFLLIVAKGIVSFITLFLNRWLIQNQVKLYTALLIVLGINLFNYKPLLTYYHDGRTYYGDIAIYLLNNIEDKDIIFYADADKYNIEGLLYYLDKFGEAGIFIAPQSMRYFPYPPYFFKPMDKKDLLRQRIGKKTIFLIYTGEKDIEPWINKVPQGYRFWVISDKGKTDILSLGIEKREYSQDRDSENFFIYFGKRMK